MFFAAAIIIAGAAVLTAHTTQDPVLKKMVQKSKARYMDTSLTQPQRTYVLKDDQGKSHSLNEFDNGLVLLNFWGTFCQPCIDEFPSLVNLAARFTGKGLKIVAVSYDQSWKQVAKFLSSHVNGSLPDNFVILMDPAHTQHDLKTSFGTEKIPETFVLVNGVIRARFLGAVDWGNQDVTTLLDYLVKRYGGV